MLKLPIDQDEMLKQMASEAVRKGEEVRATVRDLTLKSLYGRQLTLAQIKSVLRTVTEGVNLGAAKSAVNPEALLTDALAGMDDALLKAVEANRMALQKLTDFGHSFEDSRMKKALDELERYEDTLLGTVRRASAGANKNIRAQWSGILKNSSLVAYMHQISVCAIGGCLCSLDRNTVLAGKFYHVRAALEFCQKLCILPRGYYLYFWI